MNIKKTGFLLGAFAYAAVLFADNTRELKLSSPDGVQQVGFYQRQTAPAVNGLFYRVSFKGQPVIEESRAGLELDNRIWEMALGQRKLIQPACWMDNLDRKMHRQWIIHGNLFTVNAAKYATVIMRQHFIFPRKTALSIVLT